MTKTIIIGGGLSGTLTAINLLRNGRESDEVIQIEKTGSRAFRGVAYSGKFPFQPLNVQASKMSLFSDQPSHFVDWVTENKDRYGTDLTGFHPGSFVKRSIYGDYIESTFKKIKQKSPSVYKLLHGEAVNVSSENDRLIIRLKDNTEHACDHLVLALGNFPPGDVPIPNRDVYKTSFYEPNPWADGLMERIGSNDPVLLIGSGLTMVDVAINLALAGQKAPIHVLSRRGLLPRKHEDSGKFSIVPDEIKPLTSVYDILKYLRSKIQIAEGNGIGWRAVVDALREHTPTIWRNLPIADKQRFMRHLRPYWDIGRHRIPADSHKLTAHLILSGKLILHAGQIENMEIKNGKSVLVTYRSRKDKYPFSFLVHKVVNCTGPQSDYRKLEAPLLKNLFEKGILSLDPLYLGISVTEKGNPITESGEINKRVFAIGPIRKGSDWETTALREIRAQAEETANHIRMKADSHTAPERGAILPGIIS